MICGNCGTLNYDDALFCINCGKNLKEFGMKKTSEIGTNEIEGKMGINNFTKSRDVKKCPYCSEKIKAEAIKCKYCGKWLSDRQNSSKNENLKFSYGSSPSHHNLNEYWTKEKAGIRIKENFSSIEIILTILVGIFIVFMFLVISFG